MYTNTGKIAKKPESIRKEIVFVTGNMSKYQEANEILEQYGTQLKQVNLDLVEKGETQEEVIIYKAKQAFFQLNVPVIVDDTCLYIDGFDNFPGVKTKRLFQEYGFEYFERLISPSRKAYFQTIVCYKGSEENLLFYGTLEGRLVNRRRETYNEDWQYNNFFIPNNSNKYLCDFTISERKRFSHRAVALQQLAEFFKSMEITK